MNRFSHRPAHPGVERGFTLIEVLVVVAIIALLASILMPSLTAAREQAKIVKCLANLGSLGKATTMYIQASRERFPWGPGPHVPGGGSVPLTRTWYFGGNRGQSSAALGTGGFYNPSVIPRHDWSPAERPLNRYAYSSGKLTKGDNRRIGQEGDLRLYQCPSDKGVRWNGDPNSELKGTVSAYLEVGTSYQANSSWGYYAKSSIGENYTGTALTDRIKHLMDRIVPILLRKGASRGVILYEDTADWALNTADNIYSVKGPNFKIRSWHNKNDIHNLLFLDGHAAQLYVDWKVARYANQKSMTSTWAVRQFFREN